MWAGYSWKLYHVYIVSENKNKTFTNLYYLFLEIIMVKYNMIRGQDLRK